MRKKLFIISAGVSAFLLSASSALASPVSWDGDFANQILQPLSTYSGAAIKGHHFVATSTTPSIFPLASTTALSAITLCLSTDCRTVWPSGGTPGGLNLQVQYNNAGVFGGISGAVTNGTILNLTNPLLGGATLTTSSVNGVTLTTSGSAATFLNGTGNYTAINLTSGVTGVLPIANGGTATSTAPTLGQLLIGNGSGGYTFVASSTLGTVGTNYWGRDASNGYLYPATITDNVGIGTTTPANLLTIVANDSLTTLTSATNATLSIENSNSTTTNNLSALVFKTQDTNNASVVGAKFASIFTSHTPSAVSADLAFLTRSAGTLAERMRLTAAGNLAIGTTSPTSLLNISGTDSGTTITAASAAMMDITNRNTTNNNFGDLSFSTADASNNTVTTSKIVGVNTVHTAAATSGDLAFLTRSAGTLSEKMRILANGNVGIGSSTATSKVQVTAPSLSYTSQVGGVSLVDSADNTRRLMFSIDNSLGSNGAAIIDAVKANVAWMPLYLNPNGGVVAVGTAATVAPSTSGANFYINNAGDASFAIRNNTAAIEGYQLAGTSGTDVGYIIGSLTTHPLVFRSSNTTRMVITAAGSVGIGTTTPTGSGLSTVGTNYMTGLTASAGLQTGILCLSSTNQVINESVACVASAKRYKENIEPLAVGLDELMQLRPVSFTWKKDYNGALQADPNYSGVQYSLIADEVQKIDPHLVSLTTATTTFEGKEYAPGTINGLADTNHWTALFVSSIQEIVKKDGVQDSRIDDMELRLEDLEKENGQLKHTCVLN